MKLMSMLLVAVMSVAAHAQPQPQPVESLLDRAIAGPQRSEAHKARDAARHPKETLLFFGLRPDQTVIEIAPGGGWYTEILAPVLHDKGVLYAAHYPVDGSADERKARAGFEDKLQANPTVYDGVKLGTMPLKAGFTDINVAGGADLVLTFRNVHNWIETDHFDDTLRAFHAVLKPGGVLGVEEHRAPPGTTLEQIKKSGYVPEAYVIEHAKAAGFELAGRSETNANPRDNHDHPDGVWSLPPTLRGGEVDRASFVAIGESDRMTLKFVKPIRN
ncbi:MAG: methyltransferase [Rhizobacter sp.]